MNFDPMIIPYVAYKNMKGEAQGTCVEERMNELFIDSLVVFGKAAIDRTKLHPLTKSLSKGSIDLLAQMLKEDCSSVGNNLERAAERYGVDKVLAIPIPARNGQYLVAFKAYGGDPHGFFRCLDMQFISENTDRDMLNTISGLEKEVGVVIYEKTYAHNR